jgi:hypothetical protein
MIFLSLIKYFVCSRKSFWPLKAIAAVVCVRVDAYVIPFPVAVVTTVVSDAAVTGMAVIVSLSLDTDDVILFLVAVV